MKRLSISLGIIYLLVLIGCAAQMVATERLTLGTVQASLHEGMSQADVQATLGAPNIVSKDASDREVWTYDKIYKESESRSFFFWMSSTSTQKTLTVLITFDENGRVMEYKYHGTEF